MFPFFSSSIFYCYIQLLSRQVFFLKKKKNIQEIRSNLPNFESCQTKNFPYSYVTYTINVISKYVSYFHPMTQKKSINTRNKLQLSTF